MNPILLFCLILLAVAAQCSSAEDGYELWLRYPEASKNYTKQLNKYFRNLVVNPQTNNPMRRASIEELQRGFAGILQKPLPLKNRLSRGSLLLALSSKLEDFALPAPENLEQLGEQGYLIQRLSVKGNTITLVTANTERGLLYGSFALLQQLQQQKPLAELNIRSVPSVDLRVLNHWDNLDRHTERGYAGQSIWDWWHLPDIIEPRYKDYARANASIGINGSVLNNVNASAQSLTPRYIAKAAALADVFRPYGIKVYLSARFSAPIDVGGLPNSDPLNPAVRRWWREKSAEIYRAIPDFGGFLVKANSEGQPGPQDYNRSHADGANMLAEALAPHGGVVMWRAFVYSEHNAEDRAKQAYNEFMPLDGQFADNVLVQVKNGPIDFQPREPFHPLFGAMQKTPLMLELQITKEYLGFSTHLAYLGTLYEEVLQEDTHGQGAGSSVAKVADGSLYQHTLSGVAGVANTGMHRSWSGSIFDQSNWFAFGRMAWNVNAKARDIAGEWLRLSFTPASQFVEPARDIMLRSREAVVNYMTPLGLTHLMGTGHHYGPAPWVAELARPEWNPTYYHRADKNGIGFDRGPKGSNAISQYAPILAQRYGDPNAVGKELLLWFHHLPYEHLMPSGKTLWQVLVAHYDQGVSEVEQFQADWQKLRSFVDPERFASISARLKIQAREARWWRDASLAYFKAVSGRELPKGTREPEHSLEYYQSLRFPFAPGN
ncbi:MAG: alpha-glucuronidase [Cellvibrionaceae bacterium]|nr:alpha-glucuronidase [Cellvibrionaceae bacterium]